MIIIEKVKLFFTNKYVNKFVGFLKKGTSPQELALAVSIAFVLGIFPVLGSTTILCTVFALVFRLNLPLINLVNYSVYPLQVILLIPFMKIGEMIFRYEKLSYSLNEIISLIKSSIPNAIFVLWNVTIQGIGAWLLISPIIAIVLYLILNRLFNKLHGTMIK